ncbi:hypothetical protein CP532_3247 [Ophiocordyceps camponoti-leonardi (nom. inval.)]|nr:hypothetical protein CP532_3247 [Ophiocordyceps camponoti-leonardi (nom. inval.)]
MARFPLLLPLAAAVLATETSPADSFRQGVELQQAMAAGHSDLGNGLLRFVRANPPHYIDSLMRPVPGIKDANKAKCFYQRSVFQPDNTTVSIKYHPSLDFETFNQAEQPVLFSLNRSTAKIDSSWTSWQTSDNKTLSGPRITTINEFPLDVTLRKSCPARHRCAAHTWTFTVEMTGSCTLIPFVDEECLNLPWPKAGKANTTVMSLLGNKKIDEDWAIAKEYFDMTRSKHMYFGMASHNHDRGGVRSVKGQKNELRDGLYWPDEVKYRVTYKQTPRCRVRVPLMRTDGQPVREQVFSQTEVEAGERAEEESSTEPAFQQDEDDDEDMDWWDEDFDDDEEGDDMWLDADDVDWWQEDYQEVEAAQKNDLEEERRQMERLQGLKLDTGRESLKELIEESRGKVREKTKSEEEMTATPPSDEMSVEVGSGKGSYQWRDTPQLDTRRESLMELVRGKEKRSHSVF